MRGSKVYEIGGKRYRFLRADGTPAEHVLLSNNVFNSRLDVAPADLRPEVSKIWFELLGVGEGLYISGKKKYKRLMIQQVYLCEECDDKKRKEGSDKQVADAHCPSPTIS